MSDEKRREGAHFKGAEGAVEPTSPAAAAAAADDDFSTSGDYANVGRSAGLMTLLIIISRLTGFARTWFMGIAFGVSLLASSYNIANNLPNMLYELVMGGMLVTAFLPVYMEARREGGRAGANAYVSNLLSILLVLLGVVSVAAIVFAPGLIWTQAFMSAGEELDVAVYFFRIFAIQILFYGLGSVFSGVLNAHRDYFWSNVGPILNNVVVIASFAAFPAIAGVSEAAAITVLAVGTTAGVFVQMACQIPALARHGIHPRLRGQFRRYPHKSHIEPPARRRLPRQKALVAAVGLTHEALGAVAADGVAKAAFGNAQQQLHGRTRRPIHWPEHGQQRPGPLRRMGLAEKRLVIERESADIGRKSGCRRIRSHIFSRPELVQTAEKILEHT